MDTPLLAGLCAAGATALSAALAVAARRVGPRWGLVDPPADHKVHRRPVPRSGGLAWGGAVAAGLLALALLAPARLRGAGPVLLPGLGFFLLGLADDRWRLGARTKLLGQFALACLAVGLGLRFAGAGHGAFQPLGLGPLSLPLSVLWIVAVVTVVNFMDGIDLITISTQAPLCALVAVWGAGPGDGLLGALALGGLLGLGAENWSPARLFPGDATTHALGFLAASSAMAPLTGGSPSLPWPLAGALLLPGVVDVGAGLVSKWRRGVRLGAAHRDHPYQRLVRLGFAAPSVALRYGALVCVAALSAYASPAPWGPLPPLALGGLILGLHLLQASRAPPAPSSFFHGGAAALGEHEPRCRPRTRR